jgi:hypothetical protein
MRLLDYSLTPHSADLVEKLTGLQLVKKFPEFYGTWRFITAIINACQLSLLWAGSIHSWRYILIVSSHLRLGLPSGLFPSSLPTKTLYTHLPSLIRATYPAHLIPLGFITRTKYRSLIYSLCELNCHHQKNKWDNMMTFFRVPAD